MRDEKEFTDVTLACEDCQLGEAHKVILAGPSLKKTSKPIDLSRMIYLQSSIKTQDGSLMCQPPPWLSAYIEQVIVF